MGETVDEGGKQMTKGESCNYFKVKANNKNM